MVTFEHSGHAGVVEFTRHATDQINAKGFDARNIAQAIRNPREVTRVLAYRGQVRACGYGVAVVMQPNKRGWLVRTVYADGVVTPIRDDQRNDPRALGSKRLNRR